MTLFSLVKAAVTTRQAASFYGLKVSRSGITCCPFHNDRHPSMLVDERYYCFGCQETGDVIDFVGKLFGLSPYDAAKKLAADFGLEPDAPSAPAAVAACQAQHNAVMSQYRKEERCIRLLTDYERALRNRMYIYAPKPSDEEWNPQYADACQCISRVSGLLDSMIYGNADDRKETEKSLENDGTLAAIEEWLNKTKYHSKGAIDYVKNENNAA